MIISVSSVSKLPDVFHLVTVECTLIILTSRVLMTGNSIAICAPVNICRCILNMAVTSLPGGAARI